MEKKALLISCFDWYESRIVYVERYLISKGYKVKIILSDFDHRDKKYKKEHENIESVEYVSVPKYKKNLSISRIYSHLIFSKLASKKIRNNNPSLVYCLVPPNSLVKRISKLKTEYNFKLVYDIIDLWPDSFPKCNSNIFPFSIWKKFRDSFLNEADMIFLECDYYKQIIKKVVDEDKLHVFHLVKKGIPNYLLPQKNGSDSIKVCYLGSINSLIDIKQIQKVVKTMLEIKPVSVEIIGGGSSTEQFINALKDVGANVNYHGIIYDMETKVKLLSKCHFAINIYKSNLAIGLTIKSIDYFSMGLPILNSVKGDTYQIVQENNIGINLDEFNKKKLLESLSQINEMSENAHSAFIKYFDENNVNNQIKYLEDLLFEK